MPKSISDCLSVQCDWLYIDYSSSPVSQLLFTSLITHKKGWKPVLTQHWKYFCLQFNKWTWLPSPLTKWDSCVAGRQLEPNQPLTQPFHKSYFQAVQSPTAPSLNKRFSCVTMITFINRSSKKKKNTFSTSHFTSRTSVTVVKILMHIFKIRIIDLEWNCQRVAEWVSLSQEQIVSYFLLTAWI